MRLGGAYTVSHGSRFMCGACSCGGPDAVALVACRSRSWSRRCQCQSRPHLRHCCTQSLGRRGRGPRGPASAGRIRKAGRKHADDRATVTVRVFAPGLQQSATQAGSESTLAPWHGATQAVSASATVGGPSPAPARASGSGCHWHWQ